MIKAFRNKPLEPKWYGPHQVMLITAAAVFVREEKLGLMCHTVKLFLPCRDRKGQTQEPVRSPGKNRKQQASGANPAVKISS